MELVDNDTFLTKLTDLFQSTKQQGSIWLTHKRHVHDGADVVMHTPGDDTAEYPCLLRATDGNIKFSTRVNPNDLEKFHTAYGALLKLRMSTLRKRDKKREKLRAEQQAQRRKKLAEEIKVEGPKRGNGRKKRQRKAKALERQQEAKQRTEKARQQREGKS